MAMIGSKMAMIDSKMAILKPKGGGCRKGRRAFLDVETIDFQALRTTFRKATF